MCSRRAAAAASRSGWRLGRAGRASRVPTGAIGCSQQTHSRFRRRRTGPCPSPGVGDVVAGVEVYGREGRAVGGEGDDRGVGDGGAKGPNAGRLLVLRQAPRIGHEGRGVAGKETHDDAARAGVGEGIYGLTPQRFRQGERHLFARRTHVLPRRYQLLTRTCAYNGSCPEIR